MATAQRWENDPSGRTVIWRASYVEPTFGRTKIYKNLCALRQDWSLRKGYNGAVLGIRADNKRSREINEKAGARICDGYMESYADGTEAMTLRYYKALQTLKQLPAGNALPEEPLSPILVDPCQTRFYER